MLLGLLFLGTKYLFASINIVDNLPQIPGSTGFGGFLQKTESDTLGITPNNSGQYLLKVYMFSDDKFNEPGEPDYTTVLDRQTPRQDIATYTVEQILRGPTANEIENGLRPTFGGEYPVALSGSSQCGIKNFDINLDVKNYLAKVTFCRELAFHEDWGPKLLISQIRKTLIQFDKILKVQILTKDGNCLTGEKPSTLEDCVY